MRAAIDLARLRRSEAQSSAARHVLEPVFATFTEGFATRDLLTAAHLLRELASS